MVEHIVTNHLQKSLSFNQQGLLKKRNPAHISDGPVLDDFDVDIKLVTERDSSSFMA